jgi:hypothetical protein
VLFVDQGDSRLNGDCTCEPPVDVGPEVVSDPPPAVVLVIPRVHVGADFPASSDRERELIAVPGIAEEQQRVEAHVIVSELRAEAEIVGSDSLRGPNHTESVLTGHTIRLAQQPGEV